MATGRCSAADVPRVRSDAGFTLVEVLTVVVIIGVLAAVALPTFLGQKQKATDSAAKELARTAQTAAEAYSTDHNGSYSKLSVAELQAVEPTLKDTSTAELTGAEALAEGQGYVVETQSAGTGHPSRSNAPRAGKPSGAALPKSRAAARPAVAGSAAQGRGGRGRSLSHGRHFRRDLRRAPRFVLERRRIPPAAQGVARVRLLALPGVRGRDQAL
jgi:type IV pilus assembly protein PilA